MMPTVRSLTFAGAVAVVLGLGVGLVQAQTALTPAQARSLAKEAYIYGYPLVDSYRIQHAYFVNAQSPEYKAPWNQIRNISRVYTPEDRAIQTPNSDTPYSMAGLDLRTEPVVISVPPIETNRYFSVQFIDLYTHNFAYVGSRATGNGGGRFLVAGPTWQGDTPPGITQIIRSETELVIAAYRTQLFNPADLDNVKEIQAGYTIQPLSSFLGQARPTPAPAIAFLSPLTPQEQKTSLEFFNILNFVLGFCPTHPTEVELMARFARIDVGAGKSFDPARFTPEIRAAIAAGMADAWQALAELKTTQIDTGRLTSGEILGSRDLLKNNYLYRMAGAVLGIYGNSKVEAMYPVYSVDASGEPLDGAQNRYTLRFAPGHLPPVHAFWSLTMYNLPESLLVANPLHRYLLNSPMLPQFTRDADGGLTFYIQHASPGPDKEANWLPAPAGPFILFMRLYWPQAEALDGSWRQPPLQKM